MKTKVAKNQKFIHQILRGGCWGLVEGAFERFLIEEVGDSLPKKQLILYVSAPSYILFLLSHDLWS
jgi:hypothetical protein